MVRSLKPVWRAILQDCETTGKGIDRGDMLTYPRCHPRLNRPCGCHTAHPTGLQLASRLRHIQPKVCT